MNESTTRALIAAGVIGLVLYLLVKQTIPKTAATVARPPASAGAGQTSTLLKDITNFGSSIVSLGGLLKSSSSPAVPTSTTGANLIQPDAAAVASWNQVSTSDLDNLAAGDAAMDVEGPF